VEKLENDINTALNENQTGSEPKGTPWGVIIAVGLAVVAVVAIGVWWLRSRNKDEEVESE
jgi:hypothetical protein